MAIDFKSTVIHWEVFTQYPLQSAICLERKVELQLEYGHSILWPVYPLCFSLFKLGSSFLIRGSKCF